MSNSTPTTKRGKGSVGRPTKCTPEVVAAYCEGIKKHLPPELAAAYAGLSPKTVENWMRLALKGEEPYATFAAEAAHTRAEAAATLVKSIESAATSDPRYWRANAWLLEHIYSGNHSLPVLQSGDNRPDPTVIDAADLEPERLIMARIGRISDDLERARLDGSHGPALQLSRDLDKAMAELAAARRAKQVGPLDQDEETFLQLLTGSAEAMPEAHLRVFVDVYCARHRAALTRDPRWKRDENGEWYLEEDAS